MKTIHVKFAYLFGVLLPLLETIRRKGDLFNIWGYIDDYIIGLMLIVSAVLVGKKIKYSAAILAGTWGILCGGMYYSFTGQLDMPADISGLPNIYVVVIKGSILIVSIICLAMAIKSAGKDA